MTCQSINSPVTIIFETKRGNLLQVPLLYTQSMTLRLVINFAKTNGECEYRSRRLPHAKRALCQ